MNSTLYLLYLDDLIFDQIQETKREANLGKIWHNFFLIVCTEVSILTTSGLLMSVICICI